MGSASAGSYTDAAKRLAGRSVYAIGSGIVAGSRLVAKGVSALTTDTSDKEPVRFLKFAHLELGAGAAGLSCGAGGERLPVLLIGLATGFQVREGPAGVCGGAAWHGGRFARDRTCAAVLFHDVPGRG